MTVSDRPATVPIRVAGDDVAAFLYHEARLLDDRRYDDWVDLFADDGRYWVPCNERDVDPVRQVQIVYDDVAGLRSRVDRLTSGKQYVQDPPSRTCHVVSNIYVADAGGAPDGELTVHSAFTLVEARRQHHKHVFAGTCTHRLRPEAGTFRIVEKRVDLVDNDQYYENLTFVP